MFIDVRCSRVLGWMLASTAMLVLSGCALLKREPPEVREVVQWREIPVPLVSPVDDAGRQLLSWADELRTMSPEALAQEVARSGDGSSSPSAGMRLAMVLGQTRGPGDLARALQVVEGVQRSLQAGPSPGEPDWRPWARWLAQRYQQERRIEEQIERQAQALREGQRRVEQLNQTLEALKAIERQLAPRRSGERGKEGAAR